VGRFSSQIYVSFYSFFSWPRISSMRRLITTGPSILIRPPTLFVISLLVFFCSFSLVKERYSREIPYFQMVVSTADTVRYTYLLETLVRANKPVLLTGLTGITTIREERKRKERTKRVEHEYGIRGEEGEMEGRACLTVCNLQVWVSQ
jgi:hypothetical protein